ncbi:DNA alkylation repair protein [Fulvivirgaceae bacterium BMA10]|uniref:DNA alkylation repair protein n=1 Tax=Splendidivirga corallicola TaxID=3051826 RepID=A0ABT8KW30_9BACT|nr:DNA alkylation repair protein [Fulvivirgaceae bacterium BMA10]
MTVAEVIKALKTLQDPDHVKSLERYAIDNTKALGISTPKIRNLAKSIGKDHRLALELWKSNIHEAKILSTLIAEINLMSSKTMDDWVHDLYSWDICDQACCNLFVFTPFAFEKAMDWSNASQEYVKRAGFVLMAQIAMHVKDAENSDFRDFFDRIEKEADDQRNFVKKAVNWALRQIGKRNLSLNSQAIARAERIKLQGSKSAKWIASDALRELQRDQVQSKLLKKN